MKISRLLRRVDKSSADVSIAFPEFGTGSMDDGQENCLGNGSEPWHWPDGGLVSGHATTGCHILVGFRQRHSNAAETLALIERNRGGGELCPFDAADPTACEQAVARAIETHRRVDILVNNAGIRHDALENHLHSARWLAHR